jgi:hypothetical protein
MAEGKDHHPALLALARRRVDVLWALVRDGKPFTPPTAPTTVPVVTPQITALAAA